MSLQLRCPRQFLRYCSVKSEADPAIPHSLLDLRNIRVMRGGNIVLDDLTLRVQPDEHVAVLGPNGCGKSTLIKTITRECYPVARPDSSMTILGQKNWNVFELRSRSGSYPMTGWLPAPAKPAAWTSCSRASSAAPIFSPTTPLIPSTKNVRGHRWLNSESCIWQSAQ